MLSYLLDNDLIIFRDSFDSWEEAVKEACSPLIKNNSIESLYADLIIKNVNEYGPYIVIAPDICIPHAQEGCGVQKTNICFMKTKEKVHFAKNDDDFSARLFFVLCSVNNDEHLKNLQELVEMLSDDDLVSELLKSNNIEDIKKLV